MIFFIKFFFLGESMTEIRVLQVVLALDKLVSGDSAELSDDDLSEIKKLMMPDLRHRIRVIATAKVKRVWRS